jgi:sulfur relay (sulfurtransferase) complex TusBCD TusD component (DsrE family)
VISATPQSPIENLEQCYAALAKALDKAGEKHETLFLTKLALVFANEITDPAVFERAIQAALEDIAAD